MLLALSQLETLRQRLHPAFSYTVNEKQRQILAIKLLNNFIAECSNTRLIKDYLVHMWRAVPPSQLEGHFSTEQVSQRTLCRRCDLWPLRAASEQLLM